MSAQATATGEYIPVNRDSLKANEKEVRNPYQRDVRSRSSTTQESREPVEEDPRRRQYWIASLVLTAIILLMSIGSIVLAAVVFKKIDDAEGEAVGKVLQLVLYIVSMVESGLTFIAMITLVVLLAVRPRAVLIRDPSNGSFICLCIAIFFLFLCAVYSFIVPIVVKDDIPHISAGVCVISGVRFIATISFFAVLVANSKL